MSAAKRISVVLPFFNARRTLARAIGSVLATPLDEVEVIAIDDGSDDGSAENLAAHSGDGRLRVVRQDSLVDLLRSLVAQVSSAKHKQRGNRPGRE